MPGVPERGSDAGDHPQRRGDELERRSSVRCSVGCVSGASSPSSSRFRFSPLSGKATVAGRMRLARTQDVIGIAELSDGRFLTSKRNVKVTIGGCGG